MAAAELQRRDTLSSLRIEKRGIGFIASQPYLLAHAFGVSLFAPTASIYQLLKVNPHVKARIWPEGVNLARRILPQQTLLKLVQMNVSTPVKNELNPWAAFAVVGVLQGGVYGHSNVFFSQQLNIGKQVSMKGIFRGSGYAACRDMVSQGIPFVFAEKVKENVFDQAWDTSSDPDGVASKSKQYLSVMCTSIVATYLSQGCHNCQIMMHSDQTIGHVGAFRKAFALNGWKLFYRGGEARVGLNIIVTFLNQLFLKHVWD
mmetsp:Transcript_4323/g.5011  ORF Transcript_4323/g.5011 Transcript_4323/m.5011 type:complete len:259 (-) Transcript_4323:342-1118(-)